MQVSDTSTSRQRTPSVAQGRTSSADIMTAADKKTCSPDKKTPFAGKRPSSSDMRTPSAEETSPDKIAASPDKKPLSAGPGRRAPSFDLRTPLFELRTPSEQSSACHTADTQITSHAKRTASADKTALSSAFECDREREKYRCARAGSLQVFDRCVCVCVSVSVSVCWHVRSCVSVHVTHLCMCQCVHLCVVRETNRRGSSLLTYTRTSCVDT
jgi:hypothetical protein